MAGLERLQGLSDLVRPGIHLAKSSPDNHLLTSGRNLTRKAKTKLSINETSYNGMPNNISFPTTPRKAEGLMTRNPLA